MYKDCINNICRLRRRFGSYIGLIVGCCWVVLLVVTALIGVLIILKRSNIILLVINMIMYYFGCVYVVIPIFNLS